MRSGGEWIYLSYRQKVCIRGGSLALPLSQLNDSPDYILWCSSILIKAATVKGVGVSILGANKGWCVTPFFLCIISLSSAGHLTALVGLYLCSRPVLLFFLMPPGTKPCPRHHGEGA